MPILNIPLRIESESNLREHWSKKNKRHKNYFLALTGAWMQQLKETPLLPVTVTLTRVAPRQLDGDNLQAALKKIRDIIADLLVPGLKPGRADGDERIVWKYGQKKGNPKEYALIVDISNSGDLCVGNERVFMLSRH